MEHIQHRIVSLCSWLSTVISYQHNSRRGYYEEEYNLYCSWPRLIALLRPTHGTVNKTGAKGMYLDTGKNSREASSSKVVSSMSSIPFFHHLAMYLLLLAPLILLAPTTIKKQEAYLAAHCT
jgi:hypothetical protein